MELTTLEQHAMLAIIALQPNAYGISIQDHISREAGYEPSVGSIYAALDRLEEKGFVKSRHGEATPERGGRRKLLFSVTVPGEKALAKALKATSTLSRVHYRPDTSLRSDGSMPRVIRWRRRDL
jgi:DNA-binding PadR family transcriptional regulator